MENQSRRRWPQLCRPRAPVGSGPSLLILDESLFHRGGFDRVSSYPRPVRRTDPAWSVMDNLVDGALPIIREDSSTAATLEAFFRFGTRALFVVRDIQVLGIITLDQLQAEANVDRVITAAPLRVAELMTDESDAPSIDYQTVLNSTAADLLEIFDGAGCKYLVVVEKQSETLARVRGLIQRSRLGRRLMDPSLDWAATPA